MNKHILTYLLRRLLAALLLLSAFGAAAFDLDTYTSRSVLADGRWVKVSVAQTGMHFIPASDLRAWGFSDPTKVRVHGYGASRIDDLLSRSNYIDDLPMVQTINTPKGVYFFGVGPTSWSVDNSRRVVQKNNPYTTVGYYFVTQSDAPLREFAATGVGAQPADEVSTFRCPLVHEVDQMNFGGSGNVFYCESFVSKPTQTYNFTLTDAVAGSTALVRTALATDGLAAASVAFTANGKSLQGTSVAQRSPTNTHIWLVNSITDREVPLEGSTISYTIKLTRPAAIVKANLDYVLVNYDRYMTLSAGSLLFGKADADVQTLGGVDADTRIWDVTDPLNIAAVDATISGAKAAWRPQFNAFRQYVAWNESASYPAPKYVGAVVNQNLHNPELPAPDMVVFSPARWGAEAERFAALHRADGLEVMVVDQQDVFNEFGSGAPDYGAFRRMLKMLYDRGNQPDSRKLKYAVFFGAASFDNRLLTPEMRSLNVDFMPSWQTDVSNEDGPSLTSDDPAAMLTDGSNPLVTSTTLDIAVGRIPCRSIQQAKTYVDKLTTYLRNSRPGMWHNTVMAVADNGDTGTHLLQTEKMIDAMTATDKGSRMMVNKVYIDAYDLVNGSADGARNRMYRQLNDGTLLWTYVGHGALESLSADNMVRNSDIDNEMYFRNFPWLYAATCNFMQWDGLSQSGAERMFFNPSGGIIGAISATRTALIASNGELSETFGGAVFSKDADGRMLTIGEALRRAKNDLATRQRNNNRMRYSLMGSPAMRLANPENVVKLETIDGQTVKPLDTGDADDDIVVKARQQVRMTGIVTDPFGEKLTDFNGSLWVSLYDAAESVITKGTDVETPGAPVPFDDRSSLLYQGRDTVINGEFVLNISMPSEIADNYRPAMLNLYARSSGAKYVEASGASQDFYVYGVDESAEADTIAPVIEYAYLNHESFTPGSVVNEQPMFIASVTDDVGINLSMAGIGHQMTLQLDGKTIYNDVSLYYSPFADGRPGGTIAYPMRTLSEGNHELTFRVYDTSGNPAQTTLSFFVMQGAKPVIFDIYTDASPATSQARFYLQHNRPDAVITVTFEVYDMMGRRVWSSTATDRSDMFLSAPITWNLCNQGGARVTRGIYIYRAMVKGADGTVTSKAKRIAVSGR